MTIEKTTQAIRQDFPILGTKVNDNKALIYLDSAATSQKPLAVIQAMNTYFEKMNANIHRGIHALAETATASYENARKKTAKFVGVEDARQIIFTRNTTESINLVAYTWGRKNLKENDLILLTEMEHHSNLIPWYILAEEKNLDIAFIKVRDDGLLDQEHYRTLLERKPALVAFMHMSNVLGTINPAKQMIEDAHRTGAVVVIDGAQSVPHFPVNIGQLNPDFYAFSAHKMCGPTGLGILYGRMELLQAMPPFLGGGEMIKKVTFENFSTNSVPYKFEAGTPSIAEGVGMGATIDYLETIGMQRIHEHEQELTRYGYKILSEMKGLKIIGPKADQRGGVLAFTLEGIHPHDVAQILDSDGIAVRAGHHCAMPLHQRLNIPATTRASMYLYNTKADLDALRVGLEKVVTTFR